MALNDVETAPTMTVCICRVKKNGANFPSQCKESKQTPKPTREGALDVPVFPLGLGGDGGHRTLHLHPLRLRVTLERLDGVEELEDLRVGYFQHWVLTRQVGGAAGGGGL